MKYLFLLTFLCFLFSCDSSQDKNEQQSAYPMTNEEVLEAELLISTNCYTCHNPNMPTHDAMLAPPLVAVKYRYKKAYPEEEKFVQQVVRYASNPDGTQALLKGAVKKFGPMPASPVSEEQLKIVAHYLYQYKMEKPSWFDAHFEAEHGIEFPGQ